MRKKSHIKLASVIFDAINEKNINRNKLWFEVGSILPDIVPTFLWKKHRIDVTESEFRRAVHNFLYGRQDGILYNIRAGIITHYLSDYFTFPHNKECHMNLLQHNSYEGKQLELFKHINSNIDMFTLNIHEIYCLQDLFDEINRIHDEYLNRIELVMDELSLDIEYIIPVSYFVIHELIKNRISLMASPVFC